MEPLVCAAGDLVEDIVVRGRAAPVRDADIPATVTHHRGGSAANTAAVVARLGGRARSKAWLRWVSTVSYDEPAEPARSWSW